MNKVFANIMIKLFSVLFISATLSCSAAQNSSSQGGGEKSYSDMTVNILISGYSGIDAAHPAGVVLVKITNTNYAIGYDWTNQQMVITNSTNFTCSFKNITSNDSLDCRGYYQIFIFKDANNNTNFDGYGLDLCWGDILFIPDGVSSYQTNFIRALGELCVVKGTISIPSAHPGKNYGVFIDNDVNGGNGMIALVWDVAGSGTNINYIITNATTGTNFIGCMVDVDGSGGPSAGDCFGYYGGTGSSAPSNANAIMITGTNTFDFSIPDFTGF
jgi:hypothetical protein